MKLLIFAAALAAPAGTAVWQDPTTHLFWTAKDNRSGLSWRQAVRYCRELKTENYSDWRLPTIEELQGIYLPQDHSDAAFHLRGPIQLTGWQWSSTPGTQQGESWAFDFGDGGRASVPDGDSGLNRAICVRSEVKQ